MGNGGSVNYLGFNFTWKAANPQDKDKIEGYVRAAGFENIQAIIDNNPGV